MSVNETTEKSAGKPADQRLSHVDADGRPQMVDVGDKPVTRRRAIAQAEVRFPAAVFAELAAGQFRSGKKGAVIDTAIIAGTMAVKRTHELIPFCHPLPVDAITLRIDPEPAANRLQIRCEVAVSSRTGVEMEALTGASVAALTVYDMCKALSHDIVIDAVRLVAKRGGKSDMGPANTVSGEADGC